MQTQPIKDKKVLSGKFQNINSYKENAQIWWNSAIYYKELS